ncbi:histidine kinase [Oceanotoga sp. DSM 15011]|uniref:LytS/YhcK type 5TM receptor domain-containing protein n=1 Tax=Oceanotoga sp. DSM 15011 TaxID=2984951 RepID=UPI0021F4E6DC|nr:LytS/YhcK type 5TM receptor domain-containing protein [Oceanotoga sp. DSM 15011]UYP01193.1 histidine kinase [Oceanotoga sp. DSM 15011]
MEILKLFKPLFDNIMYIVLIIVFITKLKSFKKMVIKDKFEIKDKIFLGIFFGLFGILGTYMGTNVNGAIANTRNVGVIVGGILGGPTVGLIAGIIASSHRFLIDIGGITTFPCSITTLFSGLISGLIYKYLNVKKRWIYGLIMGFIAESISMLLILTYSKPFNLALEIVKSIFLPMPIIVGVGVGIVLLILENLFKQKDEMQAKQAQLALKIANKTLPYFREMNEHSIKKVCEIIKNEVNAAAVSFTDKEKILAHVGLGSDHHIPGSKFITQATFQAIKNKEIKVLNTKNEIGCKYKNCPLKSAIVVPLIQNKSIIGSLKIYFSKENAITLRDLFLAEGLSQLISTQIEISNIEKYQRIADKSELKALQAQINPHFLFNALNTIISFIRIDPDKARKLIIDLSTYLRYNLEIEKDFVNIRKEIEHVKAYFEIEKARYGDKIQLEIILDENINFDLPSLTIQPLVENSIKHGILEGTGNGKITLKIKNIKNYFLIEVTDNGKGIDEEIIKKVYNNTLKNSIGLLNVHNRLKLLYGEGLKISNQNKGTKITFKIKGEEEKNELYYS